MSEKVLFLPETQEQWVSRVNSHAPKRLRLVPLSTGEIPAHSLLSPDPNKPSPPLMGFVGEVLENARWFITTKMPWPKSHKRLDKRLRIKVRTCHYQAPYYDFESRVWRKDDWYGRRSVHDNHAAARTASYAELRTILKDRYARNESQYNKHVESRPIAVFDCQNWNGWSNIIACVHVTTYKYPPELRIPPRVFCVLEISASLPGRVTDIPAAVQANTSPNAPTAGQTKNGSTTSTNTNIGFIVVQIPLRPEGIPAQMPEGGTFANYVSIELVQRLPSVMGSVDNGIQGSLEWLMARTPNIGGWTPGFLRRWKTKRKILEEQEAIIGYASRMRNKPCACFVCSGSF